jgi:hypothetical protein
MTAMSRGSERDGIMGGKLRDGDFHEIEHAVDFGIDAWTGNAVRLAGRRACFRYR